MGEISLLREGIKTAPYLVCLIVVVWFFLRYLEKKETRESKDALKKAEMLQEDFNKRDAVLTLISQRSFDNHNKSNEIIIKNTEALGKVTHALDFCKSRG